MKKLLLPILLLLVLTLSACGNNTAETTSAKETEDQQTESTTETTDAEKENTSEEETNSGETSPETVTYQSENGPIEVPANPQRVVVLSSYAGNVMALNVNLVGVDGYTKMNPRFEEQLKDVEEISEENIEKIIELDPDLIIGLPTSQNIDKFQEIAPTVTFTWGKVDYLTQHLEIGKLLNKEKEAQAWIDDFKKRAHETGEQIKAKIGEDATVTVIENWDKQIYVFGDNWARGTEILYQEMKLNMPERVKEEALEQGWYALSQEVLPEFVGDYLIFSKNQAADNSFIETETYQNIPAVKNNRVFVVDAMGFYFSDPLTLEFQLEFFKDSFLGK